MQIFVKSSKGSDQYSVESSSTVEELKALVAGRTGLSGVELALNGRVLEDVCTLDDYEVNTEATVDAYVPLLGGKQHGSLARAGKVRGQTPKVEKQDKKKKVTGRAKRRIQYNRRFVNTVGGQFAKKGPNNLAMQQMRAGIVPDKI
ncbi:ribosomal protein S30-domain-containing protein [Baffinella frigidus]|nr:ribosomal protein S30-domain-containing protein [Cryptophyta sp. CCMP2293]|mmetsp:Transcript_66860/g.158575  ORF Transcript_66860/g.158575 Transcript_66860/m.158575 type:complete len:146 (-) Transcript_66860:88-525(-)